jgi:ribosomal protein L37E
MRYETELTDLIVCPHCGYQDKDSWEVDFGPGLDGDTHVVCDRCEEVFFVSRIVDVKYTSQKIKGKEL